MDLCSNVYSCFNVNYKNIIKTLNKLSWTCRRKFCLYFRTRSTCLRMYILYMKLYLCMLCKIWSINKIKKRVQKNELVTMNIVFKKKKIIIIIIKQRKETFKKEKEDRWFLQDSQAHNHNVSSIIFKYIFLRYTFQIYSKKFHFLNIPFDRLIRMRVQIACMINF